MSSDTPTKPRRKSLSYGSSSDLELLKTHKRHHTLRNNQTPTKEKKSRFKSTPGRSMSRKPKRAPESLLTPFDFVLAFERRYMKDTTNLDLSADHISILTAKETVKLKHKPKKKSIGFGTYQTPFVPEPSMDNINLDGWNNLDVGKKERRVYEIMRNRPDIAELLKLDALEVFPVPMPWKDYPQSHKHPLIKTDDKDVLIELGDPDTTYERQLEMLHVEQKNIEVNYYTEWFAGDPYHRNFVAMDKEMGPVIISIQTQRKDKLGIVNANSRILIRTKDSDEILFLPSKTHANELLASLKKEKPHLAKLKFTKVKNEKIKDELVQLEHDLSFKSLLKIGLLYVKQGQTQENEYYSNVEGSANFDKFLDFIGTKILLLGWPNYSGGLDTKSNLTGTHSYYTIFENYEIVFHVSTLLPHFPKDEQQVERKRHIGNDVVILVFIDGDANSFDPTTLTTNFTHVFIIISVDNEKTEASGEVHYKMAVATRLGTRAFGPRLPEPSVYKEDHKFLSFLFTKIINSERAAFEAPAFAYKLNRTKEAFLINMMNNLQV